MIDSVTLQSLKRMAETTPHQALKLCLLTFIGAHYTNKEVELAKHVAVWEASEHANLTRKSGA